MKKKYLGSSNISVPPLAFGGNVFGWTIDESKSFELLDNFFEAGYNFVDTADVYSRWKTGNSGGESETIIGRWMKKKKNRSNVILATKVGGDMGEGKKLSRTYILKAVDNSLKRLQTDYIDLYQSHFDDLNTPVQETLEAFTQLIAAGKINVIGASNFAIDRLNESVDYSKNNNLPVYQTFQPEYNLYEREKFETKYKKYCIDNNITVLCYYSLASGFLSGKYRSENDLSKSARGSGIKKYLNPRGLRILTALDEISNEYKTNPSTIALAWLQSQEGIIPIASATSLVQVKDLTGSGNITLDTYSISRLTQASAW